MKLFKYFIYAANIVAFKVFFFLAAVFRPWKKRIYIYTDSRGYDVNSVWCKKNPRGSYIFDLLKDYNVDYSICRHKHTTIIDFLSDTRRVDFSRYRAVIIHLGVVDFSPRPLSNANMVYSAKNEKVRALFGLELADGDYSLRFYEETYRNEVTASIYDVNFLRLLAKKIKSIEVPVLWIGVNRVVSGWNGNYFSERPINMNVIMEYQEALTLEMSGSQAEVWVPCVGDSEIKKYTVDNVHFSRVGFNMLSGQLRSRLRRVI